MTDTASNYRVALGTARNVVKREYPGFTFTVDALLDLREKLKDFRSDQKVKIVPADAIVLDLSDTRKTLKNLRSAESCYVDHGRRGRIRDVADQIEAQTKPVYETFGPGDVVRDRKSGLTRALSADGYVNLKQGQYHEYGDFAFGREDFTSERFERVSL